MLNMTDLYYFSPTGGTQKVGELFCAGISETVQAIDLGALSAKNIPAENPEGEVVVFAAPVFGGRIPAVAAEKIKGLDGSGKKAVTLAVYGTRAYEDALLELNHLAEKAGFQVVASAAVIAQHSMIPEIGTGRPDAQDREELLGFAGKVLEQLAKKTDGPVKVPGNDPYKAEMDVPTAVLSLPACNGCGNCVPICPTGAIRMEGGMAAASPEHCILCMACAASCPEHARILPAPVKESLEQKLEPFKNVRKDNEFFL